MAHPKNRPIPLNAGDMPVFAMRVHRIIRGGDTAHSHPWPNVSPEADHAAA